MNKLKKEYLFFKQQEPNMRTLLVTNMLYALVLPIVEIFVGAYIMRNTSVNPEKPDVPLNKNDAFQKVQKRRVQEKR